MNKYLTCLFCIICYLTNTARAEEFSILNTGLPEETNQGVIKINATYFVGSDLGLFYSSDNGESWSIESTEKLPVGSIRHFVNIEDDDYVFTCDGKVNVITDNGETFYRSQTGLPSNYNCLSLIKSDNVFYAFLADGSVYYSDDNCTNWKSGQNLPGYIMIYGYCYFKEKMYVYNLSGGQILSFDKTAANWENVSTGLPESSQVNNIFTINDNLYCTTTESTGLYKYSTEAKNWSMPDNANFNDLKILTAYKFKNRICIIDDQYKLRVSDEAFTKFEIKNAGKPICNYQPVLSSIADELIVSCPNGKILYTDLSEDKFQCLNSGLNCNLKMIDNDIINETRIILTEFGSYILDNGAKWINIKNPDGDEYLRFIVGKKIGNDYYAVAKGPGLLKLDLVNKKWLSVNKYVDTLNVVNIRGNENTMLFATYNNGLVISNDLGVSYKISKIDDSDKDFVTCTEIINNTILAAINNKSLYISTNKGETWTKSINGLGTEQFIFQINSMEKSKDKVYLYKNGDGFYYSDYSLSEWKKLNSSYLRSLISQFAVKDDIIAINNGNEGVVISYDAGKNWELFNDGLPYVTDGGSRTYSINNVAIINDKININASGFIYSKKLQVLAVEDQNKILSVNIKAFPNPVTNELLVEIPYSNSGYSMQITNESGKLLYNTDELDYGVNKFDFSKYSSGAYFVKIYNPNQSQIFKIVKN